MSVADFFAQPDNAPEPVALHGNDTWANNYATELRTIIVEAARQAPRSVQVHLGPSELGVECDRQVAAKLAGIQPVNQVSDPWPSIVGTAVHAWLAETLGTASTDDRFIPEKRVVPIDGHSGTADLYDREHFAVVDHKVLGESSLNKIRTSGPSRKYVAQLALYGLGYVREGFRVDRVALAAYPRTKSNLGGLYVWSHPFDDTLRHLIDTVADDLKRRKDYAALITAGAINWRDVPAVFDDSECYFCPLYDPSARAGCPGQTHIRR